MEFKYKRQAQLDELIKLRDEKLQELSSDSPLVALNERKLKAEATELFNNIIALQSERSSLEAEYQRGIINQEGEDLKKSHYKLYKEYHDCLSRAIEIAETVKGRGKYKPNDFTRWNDTQFKQSINNALITVKKGLVHIEQKLSNGN